MERKPDWRRRTTKPPAGVYALVLEAEGFDFLIDTRELWKAPRVVVRRGGAQAEVWLDEDDVSFSRPPKLSRRDQTRVLELVRENIDELGLWWVGLKDDVRRGRLERNVLVD